LANRQTLILRLPRFSTALRLDELPYDVHQVIFTHIARTSRTVRRRVLTPVGERDYNDEIRVDYYIDVPLLLALELVSKRYAGHIHTFLRNTVNVRCRKNLI